MSVINHQLFVQKPPIIIETQASRYFSFNPGRLISNIHSYLNITSQFASDFYCGAWAGFITGIVFTPVEYLKVECQYMIGKSKKIRALLQSIGTYKNMAKFTGPYAFLVAGACSLQFSVNRRIGSQLHEYAGILASALTGSLFLTPADHMMVTKVSYDKKQFDIDRTRSNISNLEILKKLYQKKPNALWTGFVPMIGRQAIFISSVMHLGPKLGKYLKGNTQDQNIFYSSIGRIITGVVTTILSQPFDNISRVMQKQLFQVEGKQPTIMDGYRSLMQETKSHQLSHPLFKGAVARMGMATLGGTFVGGLFDYFKQNVTLKQQSSKY